MSVGTSSKPWRDAQHHEQRKETDSNQWFAHVQVWRVRGDRGDPCRQAPAQRMAGKPVTIDATMASAEAARQPSAISR